MKIGSVLPKVLDNSPYMNLFNKRMRNQISQLDFDYELACAAYSDRETYRFKHLPEMPTDLREFVEKWKFKVGSQKEKLRERVMSTKAVKMFMDQYYGLVAENKGNAYWLEYWITVLLVKGDFIFAEGLREIYLGYPKDMRYIDGMVVWRKRSGKEWENAMAEYRREIDDKSGEVVGTA